MTIDKEKFFTVRWNNTLTLLIGGPLAVFVIVVLATPGWSNRTAFVALTLIGAVY